MCDAGLGRDGDDDDDGVVVAEDEGEEEEGIWQEAEKLRL